MGVYYSIFSLSISSRKYFYLSYQVLGNYKETNLINNTYFLSLTLFSKSLIGNIIMKISKECFWLESIMKLVGLPFKKFAHLAHNKNKVLLLYTIVKRRRLPWQYFTDAIFHNLFRFCNIILRILNWFSTFFSF